MNSASQTCQDGSVLLKILATEKKNNEKLCSKKNILHCEKGGYVLKKVTWVQKRCKVK